MTEGWAGQATGAGRINLILRQKLRPHRRASRGLALGEVG